MSTRCLTVFKDRNGQELAVMYRHCDGYPEGHGDDLKEWGTGRVIENGISGKYPRGFNGMSCAAADCVAHFKEGPGHIYLHAAGTRNVGEEYIYTFSPRNGLLWLEVVDHGTPVYEGPLEDYDYTAGGDDE